MKSSTVFLVVAVLGVLAFGMLCTGIVPDSSLGLTNTSNSSPTETNTKEGFQILGAAGSYAAQYTQCLDRCEEEDPSNSFGTPNNLNCGIYCDAVITASAQQFAPLSELPLKNTMKDCEEQCQRTAPKDASHASIRNCVSVCYGTKNVAQKCNEFYCPYSQFPWDQCMNMCTSSLGANNNSNAWMFGRFG